MPSLHPPAAASRGRARPASNELPTPEQVVRLHTQRLRQLLDRAEADVEGPRLHAPDPSRVSVDDVGELGLGEPRTLTEPPHVRGHDEWSMVVAPRVRPEPAAHAGLTVRRNPGTD